MATAPKLNTSGLSSAETGNIVKPSATAPRFPNFGLATAFGLSSAEKGEVVQAKNNKPKINVTNTGATAPKLNRPGSPGGNSPAGGRRTMRKNKSKSKKSKSKKTRKH